MFDLSAVNKRYFDIKISVSMTELIDGVEAEKQVVLNLEVEPPKVKTLKKIVNLSKTAKKEDGMDDMTEAVRLILKKNKEGRDVPMNIVDELDFDEMNQIMTAFFEWLSGEKNSKN